MSHPVFPLLIILFMAGTACDSYEAPTYEHFDDYPVYTGNDLGVSTNPDGHTFKLWSPAVEAARVQLYETDAAEVFTTLNMQPEADGVWTTHYAGDWLNKYYTYQVKYQGNWLDEAPDPYSVATGVNGARSQIIDLANTHPEAWERDQGPSPNAPTDMVIYELHLRDISIDSNAGIEHAGQYLGLTESGTRSAEDQTTGLDHLRELGVTHVHILPAFDFRSLDESLPADARGYNWGYDPHLYNVPEGSYATDPSDGRVRVREFKMMVQALHAAGIGVIMDVVYNHTGATEGSVFNRLVPGYYYRFREDGSFSDAAACGNETASERPMVRQFILQSVRYWAEEYHIDGFRFDLMGIHDIETMNQVSSTLEKIDPAIFVYGEGWTAGDSPLPAEKRALKQNVPQLDRVAAFSDEVRDAIKGHVFTHDAAAFISGQEGLEESLKFGIVGGTQHPQIDYAAVNYTDTAWAPQPGQCIVYASCHDNHTIWDRLINSVGKASVTERTRMQELALGIVLTAQGVPFLHAGSDFCRTKQGVENSYISPDSINQIEWARKAAFRPTFEFVRDMIALRKAHPAFRMQTTEEIAQHLTFMEMDRPNVVGFTIDGTAVGDDWSEIMVIYNGSTSGQTIPIPTGSWQIVVKDNRVNTEGQWGQRSSNVLLAAHTMVVLWR